VLDGVCAGICHAGDSEDSAWYWRTESPPGSAAVQPLSMGLPDATPDAPANNAIAIITPFTTGNLLFMTAPLPNGDWKFDRARIHWRTTRRL
jgi:hypothetical protein